jgi:uncharacterized protein (DUF58 family)
VHAVRSAVSARLRGLRASATERIAAWSRRRHGPDLGTVTINRRRVYILPTALGLAYGGMLFAMLLAGLNYGNNLALGLTFLLTAGGWVAMHQCHHNLAGLEISPAGTRAPFAGDDAEFAFTLAARSPREDLVLKAAAHAAAAVSLGAALTATVAVGVPTVRRGRVRLGRLRIESSFPLGLFTAWTWTHPELECLVYPRPAPRDREGPPPEAEPGAAHDGRARGEEDFAGLRSFRAGDPPRRIAWKAWARGGELVVKEYVGAARAPILFDLDAAPGRDLEARLGRLARWVVDAEERGDRYGVRLPDGEVGAGAGLGHRNRCLAMLATFALPEVRP